MPNSFVLCFILSTLNLAPHLAHADPASVSDPAPLFSSETLQKFHLTAPFTELFEHRQESTEPLAAEKAAPIAGSLSYQDSTQQLVEIPVKISLRGNSSQNLTECDFPKLKLHFKASSTKGTIFEGLRSVNIATHCGMRGEFSKIGRLNNGRSPFREELIYQMMDVLKFNRLRTQRAYFSYQDTSANPSHSVPGPVEGFFLEDIGAFTARVGGTQILDALTPADERAAHAFTGPDPFTFPDVAHAGHGLTVIDGARIDFLEWMLGNYDYALCANPTTRMGMNTGRCLYNIYAVALPKADAGSSADSGSGTPTAPPSVMNPAASAGSTGSAQVSPAGPDVGTDASRWILIAHDFDVAQIVTFSEINYTWPDKLSKIYNRQTLQTVSKEFLAHQKELNALIGQLSMDRDGQENFKTELDDFFASLRKNFVAPRPSK